MSLDEMSKQSRSFNHSRSQRSTESDRSSIAEWKEEDRIAHEARRNAQTLNSTRMEQLRDKFIGYMSPSWEYSLTSRRPSGIPFADAECADIELHQNEKTGRNTLRDKKRIVRECWPHFDDALGTMDCAATTPESTLLVWEMGHGKDGTLALVKPSEKLFKIDQPFLEDAYIARCSWHGKHVYASLPWVSGCTPLSQIAHLITQGRNVTLMNVTQSGVT